MTYKMTETERLVEEIDYIFKVVKKRFPGFYQMFNFEETSYSVIKSKYVNNENFGLRKIYKRLHEITEERKVLTYNMKENISIMAFYIWVISYYTINDLFDAALHTNSILYISKNASCINDDYVTFVPVDIIKYNTKNHIVSKTIIDIPEKFDCAAFITKNFGEKYLKPMAEFYKVYKYSEDIWYIRVKNEQSVYKNRFYSDVKEEIPYRVHLNWGSYGGITDDSIRSMMEKCWLEDMKYSKSYKYSVFVRMVAKHAHEVILYCPNCKTDFCSLKDKSLCGYPGCCLIQNFIEKSNIHEDLKGHDEFIDDVFGYMVKHSVRENDLDKAYSDKVNEINQVLIRRENHLKREIERKEKEEEYKKNFPFLGSSSRGYSTTKTGFCIELLFSAFVSLPEIEEYLKSHDIRDLCKYALRDYGSMRNMTKPEVDGILNKIDTTTIEDIFPNDDNYVRVYFRTKPKEPTINQDEIDAKEADKYASKHKRAPKIDDLDDIYDNLVKLGEDLYN